MELSLLGAQALGHVACASIAACMLAGRCGSRSDAKMCHSSYLVTYFLQVDVMSQGRGPRTLASKSRLRICRQLDGMAAHSPSKVSDSPLLHCTRGATGTWNFRCLACKQLKHLVTQLPGAIRPLSESKSYRRTSQASLWQPQPDHAECRRLHIPVLTIIAFGVLTSSVDLQGSGLGFPSGIIRQI